MKTVQGEFTTSRHVENAKIEALTVMGNANGIKLGAWHWQKLTKSVENMKSNGEKNTGVY